MIRVLTADRSTTSTSIADVTGLNFPVRAGKTYYFRFHMWQTAGATTTGARLSVNGPAAPTALYFIGRQPLTSSSSSPVLPVNYGAGVYDDPASAQAASFDTTANYCDMEGIIIPSADGVVTARFATEVGGSAIGIKAGSFVEFIELDPTKCPPNMVILESDVSNNNAVANTIEDVTGLGFQVTAGIKYYYRFFIPFTTAATTTGSRWSLNGPAVTSLLYDTFWTNSAITGSGDYIQTAYDLPAAAGSGSVAAGNVAVIEGTIHPSADGFLIVRHASEVANSLVTAKAGAFGIWKQLAVPGAP